MPATILPYVTTAAYTVAICAPAFDATPAWYFYYLSGSEWRCWAHNAEGTPLEEVGAGLPVTEGYDNDLQGCVPAAAGYHAAARLFRSPNALHVYDFASGQISSYNVPAPWVAGPAQWVAGAFHWIEWQPGFRTFSETMPTRLMRAGADFDSPEVVGTHDVGFFISGDWENDFAGPDFTSSAAAISIEHRSEEQFWVRVRFDLGSGIGSVGSTPSDSPPTGRRAGWPLPAGGSLRLAAGAGLQSWSGGVDDGYAPWNPANLDGEYQDLFIADGRIYLSWGVSTPINPTATPESTIEGAVNHPELGAPFAFCKVAAP